MLKGSLKEKSKLMKSIDMEINEKILVNIFHAKKQIGQRIISVDSIEMVISAKKENEIIHRIKFTTNDGYCFG